MGLILSYKKFDPPQGGLVGVFGCQKNKSPGNVMNCPENRYIFVTPSEDGEKEGRTGGGDREGEREREAGREGGARPKPGNQLVHYISQLVVPL